MHAFLSHQAQPDEDFDTIVGCLKEQAQFWSLASESNPKRLHTERGELTLARSPRPICQTARTGQAKVATIDHGYESQPPRRNTCPFGPEAHGVFCRGGEYGANAIPLAGGDEPVASAGVGGTAATGRFAQLVRSSRRGVPERHVGERMVWGEPRVLHIASRIKP